MILYSIERLYHFKCTMCDSWWTIGDYKNLNTELICPFCGHKHIPCESN